MNNKIRQLCLACCFIFIPVLASATADYSEYQLEVFDNEPPLIRDLLLRANVLLGDSTDLTEQADVDKAWQAASLYCEASRFGSAEGIYRLGMLYAFGKGVPENKDYAANLFGIAARHGHFEAQKMLETIEITNNHTPQCVVANVAPEKAQVIAKPHTPAIDAYIASLPKNKRWVVDLADKVATWYKVDSKLVLSIITAESNFHIAAESNKDAQGLMQLIPATAERFNVKDAYNASQNIKGGVKYLRWLLSYFRGDVTMAVAAYNAGEKTVDKYHGVPPYPETKAYVKKVMELYAQEQHAYDAGITNASPELEKIRRKSNANKKIM
jgi:hypothetical protein